MATFTAFVESDNINEAARRLGISQPAVSVQLKRLEEQLPLPLFTFQGKKKVLSHYGRALYDKIYGTLGKVNLAIEEVNKQYADPSQITIRLGCRREIISRIADRIRFPGTVEMIVMTGHDANLKIANNEIDVAISDSQPSSTQIISKKLFSEGTRLVIHRSLLKEQKLTEKLIRSESFLTETPSIIYRVPAPFMTQWCEHSKVDFRRLKIKAIVEDWSAIMKMVEAQMGFSIVPEKFPHQDSKNLCSIPIPKTVIEEMSFYILYTTALRRLITAEKFLSF